jgi:hypothetical protein
MGGYDSTREGDKGRSKGLPMPINHDRAYFYAKI